jgi:glycine/D-amino acid oxidase-like deaminating enzyme
VITVIGAGLAGSLLTLELAGLGQAVRLIDAGDGDNATALSYGLIPPGGDGGAWRRLHRLQRIEGLRRRWLQLGPRGMLLPALQVDPQRFAASVRDALQRLGVERRQRRLEEPRQLDPLLAEGPVVLACGSGCRRLAPQLSDRLRSSWAGILELAPAAIPAPSWLARLPARFERLALERRSESPAQEQWIVDAGLVPCGERLLAGQITLLRPGLETGEAPDAAVMEQRLRAGLAQRWPALAQLPGRYRQAPVSYSNTGVPLAEPVATGLWVLAGFSGAFRELPASARSLAARIATQPT